MGMPRIWTMKFSVPFLCWFLTFITAVSVQRSSKLWCSSTSSDIGNDETKKTEAKEDFDEILGEKKNSHFQAQGVDPRRGWGFRGVHKVFHM